MATDGAEGAYPSPPASPARQQPSIILRNALRYSLSPDEYDKLQKQFKSHASPSLRKRLPLRKSYSELVGLPEDYTTTTVRATIRIFIASQLGLELWEQVKTRLLARGRPVESVAYL